MFDLCTLRKDYQPEVQDWFHKIYEIDLLRSIGTTDEVASMDVMLPCY